MKAFIASAAAIAKYQRADAAFHMAIDGAQPTVSMLEANGMTPERAREKLSAVPEGYVAVWTPLLAANERATEEGLREAASRYPLEALAMALAAIDAAIEEREAARAKLDQEDLNDLAALPTDGLPN